MELDIVLAKTEKGKEELDTRRSLSVDMRHALILVDGHSTLKELLKKGEGIPLLSDSLNILLRTGFIYSPNENPVETSASPSTTPETSSRPGSGNGSVKAQLIHLATNLLGKQSEKIIKKIEEAADSKEALLSTIEGCGKIIRLVIDEQKADTFVVAAKDILSHKL